MGVRRESEKLFDQESKNQHARKTFQEVNDLIKTFLDDFKPEGGHPPPDRDKDESDTDDDEAGRRKGIAALKWKIEDAPAPVGPEQRRLLSKRLMPQFTRYIAEDKEAVQNAGEMLTLFIEKFFKSSKELAALKEKQDPIQLLKGLLRVISLELGLGKRKKPADKDGEEEDGAKKEKRKSKEKDKDKDKEKEKDKEKDKDRDRD